MAKKKEEKMIELDIDDTMAMLISSSIVARLSAYPLSDSLTILSGISAALVYCAMRVKQNPDLKNHVPIEEVVLNFLRAGSKVGMDFDKYLNLENFNWKNNNSDEDNK